MRQESLRGLLRLVNGALGPAALRTLAVLDALAPKAAPAPQDREYRNILLVKLVGLGDTALMLPTVKRLRERFPGARLTVLVSPLSRGVLEGQPYVDEAIVYDVLGAHRGVGGLIRVVGELRARDFDLLIDFEQHLKLVSVLCRLSGARRRIGFDNDVIRRGALYTDTVALGGDRHMARSFGELLRPLSIDFAPDRLEKLELAPDDRSWLALWLRRAAVPDHQGLVGIHAGSGGSAVARRWPAASFAQVADRMIDELGVRVVLVGGKDELGVAGEVRALMRSTPLLACGETTVGQLAALAARCRLFLANDSAPMHIAAAMGTPTIGLFGPNSPERYAPFGPGHASVYKAIPCSPCINVHHGIVPQCHNPNRLECVKNISCDEVWLAVRSALDGPSQSAKSGSFSI